MVGNVAARQLPPKDRKLIMNSLKKALRMIPDFPKPGIQFQDISPLLQDPSYFNNTIQALHRHHQNDAIDLIAAIESRGFIFGAALAYALGCGTVLIRKPNKLPGTVYQKSYDLEYGTNSLEVQTDAFQPHQRVLLVDDVLATGGTVSAAQQLIQSHFDVQIIGATFLLEIMPLEGRHRLTDLPIHSLIQIP
jgi:adenine phosphoribosyltransferase